MLNQTKVEEDLPVTMRTIDFDDVHIKSLNVNLGFQSESNININNEQELNSFINKSGEKEMDLNDKKFAEKMLQLQQNMKRQSEYIFSNPKILNPKKLGDQSKKNHLKSLENESEDSDTSHPFDKTITSESDFFGFQSHSIESKKEIQITKSIRGNYSDIAEYKSNYIKNTYPDVYLVTKQEQI